MWDREFEFGTPLVPNLLLGAVRSAEGVARVELIGIVGAFTVRTGRVGGYRGGFGVVLDSPDGSRIFLVGFIGVLMPDFGAFPEVSEMGGDGGVGVSDTVSVVETDFVSGGVVIMGEEAAESGEPAREGEFGAVISVDIIGKALALCFRSLSCIISASIFRSDSSSRSLCASIRRFSLSCSPIFISSSIITPLSMATLNLDSRSSRDDEVFLACLSKSSFATSMSRSLSCSVRLASLNVVISFCSVFWATFASALACLYFDCGI
jgi:hypothetical protein